MKKGLTLVEVLVALVIACVAVAALAVSARAAVRSRAATAMRHSMFRLAERTLEEMLASDPRSLRESVTADVVSGFPRRCRVSAGPRPDLWRIEVTVGDRDDARLRTLVRGAWRE